MQIWHIAGKDNVCVYVSDFDMEVTNMHLYFFQTFIIFASNVYDPRLKKL